MLKIEDQQTRLSRKGLAAVRALRDLKAQQDELRAKIKRHEDVLKGELAGVALGGKLVGVDGHGHPLVSYKSVIRQTLNATLLRKRDPELARECTTESEVKTLTVLGEQ